jgi:hypothetical protein
VPCTGRDPVFPVRCCTGLCGEGTPGIPHSVPCKQPVAAPWCAALDRPPGSAAAGGAAV